VCKCVGDSQKSKGLFNGFLERLKIFADFKIARNTDLSIQIISQILFTMYRGLYYSAFKS